MLSMNQKDTARRTCFFSLRSVGVFPSFSEADNLGKVIEILPQGEELQELMDFKKNNDPSVLPWGRAEDFLLQLLDVPNFKTRAECCLTKSKFDPICKEILQDIELLHKCLSCVVDSQWLPNIFALVMQMGNYLNHGTNKGQQRGFTLDTLPLLTRVEGFQDKSYSLIRFLMDTLESDRKVKDGAMKDLELCESAAKLDFEESARRLNEIEKKVTSVEKSLQEINDDSGAFKTPMEAFVTTAQGRLSKLREKVEEATGQAKQTFNSCFVQVNATAVTGFFWQFFCNMTSFMSFTW